MLVRVTGIHPVPLTARVVDAAAGVPEAAVNRALQFAIADEACALQMMFAEPSRSGVLTSARYNESALFKEPRSEILFESRACFKSCAGFRVRMTTTARIAT